MGTKRTSSDPSGDWQMAFLKKTCLAAWGPPKKSRRAQRRAKKADARITKIEPSKGAPEDKGGAATSNESDANTSNE